MLSFSGHPFRPPPSADHSYANGNTATMVASGGGPVCEIQGVASVACQTDITSSDIDEEKREITRPREQLGEYQDRQRTTRENFVKHMTESDSNTRYFTGMPSVAMLLGIFNLVMYSCGEITYWRGPGTQERRRESTGRSLTKWHEYLLTLVRIRLGIDLELVGFLFGIHFSTASRIFITWVYLLHGTLKHDLKWPDRASVQAYMPQDFKLRYPKTRVIIDSTEFETQRPKNTKNQARTYSQYKGRNTCKALVGINPNGAFTFVSDVWSGNISDRQITINSGFLDLIEEGDEVMADRGFTIRDLLLERNATLNIPPFTKACPQRGKGRKLSRQQILKTRAIASLRIHVERAIRRMKSFKLLSNVIDAPMRDLLDKIIVIVAVLSNLQGPLIRNP